MLLNETQTFYFKLGALASKHSFYTNPRETMLSLCSLREVRDYFESFLDGWAAGDYF